MAEAGQGSGVTGYTGAMDNDRAWIDVREQVKAELRERYPDWQIWYVPSASDSRATWHARPRLKIDADTPGLLEAGILSMSQQASNGFDPEGDTPDRAKGSQGV